MLCLFVERRPKALFRDVVRPETFISESTLGVVVNGLGQALGDDPRSTLGARLELARGAFIHLAPGRVSG